MSTLQFWLAVLGGLTLAGVVAHGAWQSRRSEVKRAEDELPASGGAEAKPESAQRLEPSFIAPTDDVAETAPAALACTWDSGRPGNIGLPLPGVALKLVPNEGKLEARLGGPHISPGYWRQDEHTRDAFDDEGFYKLGDALKFADPSDPGQGLLFDGRIAEDFKLSTGTWVSWWTTWQRRACSTTPS